MPGTASQHHVQLFDSSKSLAETVSQFLADAYHRGEPLLIVATPQHREMLRRGLETAGVNVHSASVADRIVIADAAQTLDKFMRQDTPGPIAFYELVGGLLARLGGGGRVCVYGEMVDVLAARGNYKGALLLEELWNDLAERESFTLFCGYASGHFGDPRTARHLAEICAAHQHLHRKRGDLLAGFLLDQPEVRARTRRIAAS
jgi:hypothetical protein